MVIQSLTVTRFRNINSAHIEPSDGLNVFSGPNGAGKTNFLEAIFTLCLGRSQKGAADTVLVNNISDYYRLEGNIRASGRVKNVAVAYQTNQRKKITIDGVTSKASELFGHFCAVAAGPEDSDILSGSPSARRLFLDMYLSQLSGAYLASLTSYQQALAQKNAALKNGMDTTPFDDLLVAYGSDIMRARGELIVKLNDIAGRYYSEIASGESLQIKYAPSVNCSEFPVSDGELRAVFEEQIAQQRERERILGSAQVGPHRDDVSFFIAGQPARNYGSQGQWRTAAISLKLGVFELLREVRNQPPVLLLDEIFAELDAGRTMQLINSVGKDSQVFLTTALEPEPSIRERARCFKVGEGRIEGVS